MLALLAFRVCVCACFSLGSALAPAAPRRAVVGTKRGKAGTKQLAKSAAKVSEKERSAARNADIKLALAQRSTASMGKFDKVRAPCPVHTHARMHTCMRMRMHHPSFRFWARTRARSKERENTEEQKINK